MYRPLDPSFVAESGLALHPSVSAQAGLPKTLLDRTLALLGLLLLMPLMLLIALAIRLDSPGPVLFKQARIGLHGRQFLIYKFRSMQLDAESRLKDLQALNEMEGPLFKLKHDPRITRIGRWLRKTSLDELPQLINVLKGDMSLVGPRPPLPSEVVRYQPWHLGKFAVRPGITGLWQVSGRNEIASFDQMIELDLSYIRTWSFATDLQILAKTVPAVLNGHGAR